MLTVLYFLFFLSLPFVGWFETTKPVPATIADAILAKNGGPAVVAVAAASRVDGHAAVARDTGDERGAMLADAANTLADALSLIQPHDNRTLWMAAATFRGDGSFRAFLLGIAWFPWPRSRPY